MVSSGKAGTRVRQARCPGHKNWGGCSETCASTGSALRGSATLNFASRVPLLSHALAKWDAVTPQLFSETEDLGGLRLDESIHAHLENEPTTCNGFPHLRRQVSLLKGLAPDE